MLADNELNRLLPLLNLDTGNAKYPFDAATQVQPASIDIRLDNVFWELRPHWWRWRNGKPSIDLRRSSIGQVRPRRHWRKVELADGECKSMRPGETLLGRTLERFSMPNGYVGVLIGRSSLARIGVMIHCTGGHINPGWEGRMPLQIVNLSGTTVKIPPYVSVCQIVIMTASSKSARPYGDAALSSRYQEDDGGPTFWWKQGRPELKLALISASLQAPTAERLMDIVGEEDPEILDRLERFVDKLPNADSHDAGRIAELFAASEDKYRVRRNYFLTILKAGGWVSLFLAFLPEYWKLLAVIPIALAVVASQAPPTVAFGRAKLNAKLDSKRES